MNRFAQTSFILLLFYLLTYIPASAQGKIAPSALKAQIENREDSLRNLVSYFVGHSLKRGRKARIIGYTVVGNTPIKVYDEYIKTFKSGQTLNRRYYYFLPKMTVKRMNERILYATYLSSNGQLLELFNETIVGNQAR
ncbi:hypothetical protein WBJ53_09430 [Spirosoma sp. SC4-14]|uniref:hypothetical protein n=1 Tax=Spirosoma sp. SC4-14 TaxID=3128900 RepID=UPI0030CFAEC2